MKIVVCAYKGVGKTTLAKKVIENSKKEVYGYFTSKFPDRLTSDGLCPIYIYPAGKEPIFDDNHLVGYGGGGTHYTGIEAFNTTGVELISVPKGKEDEALIVMDEVGFLEGKAEDFKKKVFECLLGKSDVLLMLKQFAREPFLEDIKNHPGIKYYDMNEDNRDDITRKVLEDLT